MDGKGKYSNKEKVIASQIKTYQNAVKNGASRRSVVIYCFDCDEYDTNQGRSRFSWIKQSNIVHIMLMILCGFAKM